MLHYNNNNNHHYGEEYNNNNYLNIMYPPCFNVDLFEKYIKSHYEQALKTNIKDPPFPTYIFINFQHIFVDQVMNNKLNKFVLENLNNQQQNKRMQILNHDILIKDKKINVWIALHQS